MKPIHISDVHTYCELRWGLRFHPADAFHWAHAEHLKLDTVELNGNLWTTDLWVADFLLAKGLIK